MSAAHDFDSAARARVDVLAFMSNSVAITDLLLGGLCVKYPRLKFVSVESGFGYLPFLVEACEWQFHQAGVFRAHPEWPTPSELFRRQVYGSFWFERSSLSLLDQYPNNIMFETDFPHPTSLSPGPASIAKPAREHVKSALAEVPDHIVENVLGRTASSVYHVDLPD